MIVQGASSSDMQNSEARISQLLVLTLHFNWKKMPTYNEIICKKPPN